MKVVCISDTHLRHEELIVPDGDVLVFAGDMCMAGCNLSEVSGFARWLGMQPHEHKIAIAGNHDFLARSASIGEAQKAFSRKARRMLGMMGVNYLEDDAVEAAGLRFWGTPWQPRLADWAFNLDRGPGLRAKWKLIPADTDVLVTHAPPRNILDMGYATTHAGCDDLRDEVLSRVRPKLHVFGHMHSGHGRVDLDGTVFVNAAVVNEQYRVVNRPVVIEL